MITHTELMDLLHYDSNTGQFTWRVNRGTSTKAGEVAGCISGNGHYAITINYKTYRAHRLAWLYMTGNWPTQQIDHINRNELDNRFCNLREVTNHENQFNKNAKGYTWDKNRQKWRALIKINNKSIHLGHFDNKQEAHEAYLNAKKKYHKIRN